MAMAQFDESVQRAVSLQKEYWQFDPDEKRRLVDAGVEGLAWPEKLRLLHLACLELCGTRDIRKQIESDTFEDENAPPGAARDLCARLARDLSGSQSPYRRRCCGVWQGEAATGQEKGSPDLEGTVQNPSVTHLGALEVIRLDEDGTPKELSFVGLQEIQGLRLAPPALFRFGKIFYEKKGHAEMVWVPLLYGMSWFTPHEFDRDGTMTRFVAHLPVEGSELQQGVGIGQQDLTVSGKGTNLVGLGSIAEINTALDMREPDFEEKCRLRGLDPDEMRRSLG